MLKHNREQSATGENGNKKKAEIHNQDLPKQNHQATHTPSEEDQCRWLTQMPDVDRAAQHARLTIVTGRSECPTRMLLARPVEADGKQHVQFTQRGIEPAIGFGGWQPKVRVRESKSSETRRRERINVMAPKKQERPKAEDWRMSKRKTGTNKNK